MRAHGWTVVSCTGGRSLRTREAAEAAGVELVPSLDEVVRRSDLVVSLVPQTGVLETAAAFAAAAAGAPLRRPIYVDANSVAPATVRDVAAVVTAAGAGCVDGAFTGNAASLPGRTTLYVSGPCAVEVEALFGEAIPVRVLGDEIGTASAFKLCFSGFNKGLVALFLEMVTAADRLGQRDELVESLRAFYPGSVETVERLLPTYPRHAGRRVAELDEVLDWLREIGQSGHMAAATRSVIAEVASLDVPDASAQDAEALLSEYCRRGLLARDDTAS
jgi:3-hydroxyisobutyrate dehydrogenase-like beta-hydroxyacid dehydrogenase